MPLLVKYPISFPSDNEEDEAVFSYLFKMNAGIRPDFCHVRPDGFFVAITESCSDLLHYPWFIGQTSKGGGHDYTEF